MGWSGSLIGIAHVCGLSRVFPEPDMDGCRRNRGMPCRHADLVQVAYDKGNCERPDQCVIEPFAMGAIAEPRGNSCRTITANPFYFTAPVVPVFGVVPD